MKNYELFYNEVFDDLKLLKDNKLTVQETLKKYSDIFKDENFDKTFQKQYGILQLTCVRGILFSLDTIRLYGDEAVSVENVIEMLKGILKIEKFKIKN